MPRYVVLLLPNLTKQRRKAHMCYVPYVLIYMAINSTCTGACISCTQQLETFAKSKNIYEGQEVLWKSLGYKHMPFYSNKRLNSYSVSKRKNSRYVLIKVKSLLAHLL